MRKKIYLFFILSSLLMLTSCDDSMSIIVKKNISEQNISTSTKRESNKSKKSSLSLNKKSIFQEMGIEFNNNKLIIDINKTDNFFKTLDKRFEKKIEQEVDKIDINISRDLGINIEEDEIKIDMNKTKNMLDNISHIFEALLFESNTTKF